MSLIPEVSVESGDIPKKRELQTNHLNVSTASEEVSEGEEACDASKEIESQLMVKLSLDTSSLILQNLHITLILPHALLSPSLIQHTLTPRAPCPLQERSGHVSPLKSIQGNSYAVS